MTPLKVIMQQAAVYHLLGPCDGCNKTPCNECTLATTLPTSWRQVTEARC